MSGLYSDLYHSSGEIHTQGSTKHSIPGANTKIAKMKKLNIFSASNKKGYNRNNSSPITPPAGDTINRIVSKKEEVSCLISVKIPVCFRKQCIVILHFIDCQNIEI